jgi:hypothetical protein
LEHRANLDAEMLDLQRQITIETSPANVLGIEINAYAAELARVASNSAGDRVASAIICWNTARRSSAALAPGSTYSEAMGKFRALQYSRNWRS